jgi:Icc-related predicted phosphoesterase
MVRIINNDSINSNMKITFISDTHNKHNLITEDLPGGDLLIHAGDISSMGYEHEITNFCKWLDNINNYKTKVFISGNHDWGFQDSPTDSLRIINTHKSINYLQDDLLMVGENYEDMVKIWGSPWQPEFYNWAFNLPRNGDELKGKWGMIPMNTDILVTHGPAWGFVDTIKGTTTHLGCELLTERIKEIKPKIHVCGHIHSGHGYVFDGNTHFINAAVLGERYTYENKPITVEWDPKTNELEFL